MRFLGRTQRRVILAILLTAVIPLVISVGVARAIIGHTTDVAFNPELGDAIDKSLFVYADLVQAIKSGMRHEAEAIAQSERLRALARADDATGLGEELTRVMESREGVVELVVTDDEGGVIARHARAVPPDPTRERTLTVRQPLDDAGARVLAATFSTPSVRFDEQESLQSFAQVYRQVESKNRATILDQSYFHAFSVLLVLTILVAMILGVLVARPVTRGVARLVEATRPVAAGDLSVRVEVQGNDEVAGLGRAFNRMLEELEESRARVEFLRRMGEWQKMARRLAHEIKNPLTPIQLAVEECHRRYTGDDATYQKVVETTLEVVVEEVASLRRLVTQFSSFARLPRAELQPADLATFLEDQREHIDAIRGARAATGEESLIRRVDVRFELPDQPMPALLDVEMMHRLVTNLVTNAAQALRDRTGDDTGDDGVLGTVEVTARLVGSEYVLTFDDDGPGVPPDLRASIFDPYVTTKHDGTGLGLAIVKKVVVDHGGRIEVTDSPMGGARFAIRLPVADSASARAAAERVRSERPAADDG